MQSEGPLRLSFTGILRDLTTNERIDVTWTYLIAADGSATMTVAVHGQQFDHQCGHVHGMMTRFLHAVCFGDTPPGERCIPDRRIPAPINIDRSPRNTLRDRLHRRRQEPEATAAD